MVRSGSGIARAKKSKRRSSRYRGSAKRSGRKYARTSRKSSNRAVARARSSMAYSRPTRVPRPVAAPPPITPHAWTAAVVNPFSVSNCRIPDGTAHSTFTIVQNGSCVLQPQDPSNGLPAGRSYVNGYRLRPSMNDGTTSLFKTTPPLWTGVSDALCPCLSDGGGSYWQNSKPLPSSGGGGPYYVWGDAMPYPGIAPGPFPYHVSNGVAAPYFPQEAAQFVTGSMGFALQNGSMARPTAWGFRIKYAGLRNTPNNLAPFGRVYFGINTPQYEGNEPGQVEFDNYPVYDGNVDATGKVQNGPSKAIQITQLVNNAQKGLVGMLTLEELRSMPSGIVIGTGPRSTKELLFRDVNWWTGIDRNIGAPVELVDAVPGVAGQNVSVPDYCLTALPGSQPWFFIEGGFNAQFTVEYIIHWEVVPATTAYTLPGTTKSEPANSRVMDSTFNTMNSVQNNPSAGASAAGRLGTSDWSYGPHLAKPGAFYEVLSKYWTGESRHNVLMSHMTDAQKKDYIMSLNLV